MNMFELLDQDAAFFELAQRRNLLFYHKGYFSHSIVAAMSEVVKLQLEVATEIVFVLYRNLAEYCSLFVGLARRGRRQRWRHT
jgi:hypothetical protein